MGVTTNGTAKHETVRDQLRQIVLRLDPGQALPAERQLAEQCGVARMTVRQAIGALAREGLVRSVHGAGNFRSVEPLQLQVRLGSFADALRERDLEPVTEPLECVVEDDPPEHVAVFLGLTEERPALRLRRVRLGSGVPLAVERTWIPADLLPGFTEADLAGSLYHYLEALGLLPDSGEESVAARLPEDDEAALLHISPSRPVLRLIRRALVRGEPVEYAEAVFPADHCELWFPLRPE